MVGLSRSITLSFMVVGHTKFAPDAGFGLIKKKYKKTNVECLQDIVEMVNNSAAVNEARLVGTQDEQTLIPLMSGPPTLVNILRRSQTLSSTISLTLSLRSQEGS